MYGSNLISVPCKRCGKSTKATEFVLDPVYRMMVCPVCVRERRDMAQIKEKRRKQENTKKKEMHDKPAGWDRDDEYLLRLESKKQEKLKARIQRIGPDKIKYMCPNCSYKFTVILSRAYRSSCPYCGSGLHL